MTLPTVGVRANGARKNARHLTGARANEHAAAIESIIGDRVKIDANGCWIYGGRRDRYARHERVGLVHRFVYQTMVGRIPPGMVLHHRCEVKGCVNPQHLAVLTTAEHGRVHADARS